MSQPNAAASLKRAALGDLAHEISTTRRVLERVPDEHLSWKPHAKSFSLGHLALHIANLLLWQITTVRQDGLDLATLPQGQPEPSSRDEVLRRFDENAATLREAMESLDDAALQEPWTLRRGDHVVFQQPRLAVLRGMGISHLVHHRGQLSVYLRLLDVPVPPIYGPTADEAM